MDIAKYIGLFLLKNNICYIPGMGNLEIKKVPAVHNGESLKAPVYEILITPGGSIDDSLANFIATNEKISIASASNGIRNFVTASKEALHHGDDVVIPSLGYFTETNGKLEFVTDPNFKFTPAPIPTVKHAPRTAEQIAPVTQPQSHYSRPSNKTNWGRTIIIGIVAGIVLGGIVAGIMFMNRNADEPGASEKVLIEKPKEVLDSIPRADNVVTEPEPPATPIRYQVIINTYNSRDKAEAREKKLTSYGNNVEMIAKDSNTFYVVVPVTVLPADTAHVLDSLKALFNPNGVSLYR